MYKLTPLALALSLLSGYAVAQSAPNAAIPQAVDIYTLKEQVDPDGAMRVGSFYLYPTVGITFGHDDNVNAVNTNTKSSSVFNLSPSLLLEQLNAAGDTYSLGYRGSYTRYTSSSKDNNDTHEVQGQVAIQYDPRLNTLFRAGVLLDSDARELTDRPESDRPDKYRNTYANYLVGYGANEAPGRVEAEVKYNNKRYTNNRSTTLDGDLDAFDLAGRFFYRVAPNSQVFVEARYTDFDYKLATPDQDSTEQRLLLGYTWDITAATQGTIKAGNLKKDFTSNTRKDFNGFTWEGKAKWMPVEYSTVELTTRRATDDSTGTGDYIKNRKYSIAWTHKLTDLFSASLAYSDIHNDYVNGNRLDKMKQYSVGVGYDVRRWMKMSLEWKTADNDSTVRASSYKRNVIMLNTQIGL